MAEAKSAPPSKAGGIESPSLGPDTADWDQPIPFAPGVTLYRKRTCDEYHGYADDLVAVNLCRADQFPGLPGRNIGSSTYWPDGTPKRAGGSKQTDGTLTILRYSGHFICRFTRLRTPQELDYWIRKYAEEEKRQAEIASRRESERNANAQAKKAPPTPDEYWRAEFDGASDAFIAGCIQSNRDTGAAMRRAAQEIFDSRRKAQVMLAGSEGNVIFPKCWTKG